jgi:hypothetical protein
LFNKTATLLIQCPGGKQGAYVIPNSVTTIGNFAFANCSSLPSVTIPDSVTSIGNFAFAYCWKMTGAYFLGNAPAMGTQAFYSCASGFTVYYVSGTTGWFNPWYGYPTTTTAPTKKRTVLILQIGKQTFTVNGAVRYLDSPPVIKNGRTLLPIRAIIIDALGGSVDWDAIARKVIVTLDNKTIELWIGKSTAAVNGVSTPIDPANASVVPEIISGRTMLPLRFITESLGATLGWDQNTQTITITYQS